MADFKWAAGIKSFFKPKGEGLSEFIEEVNTEHEANMFYQKAFDLDAECRPTFEQLSNERIVDEINKDLQLLKSMESILNERTQAFSGFVAGVSKARPSFDAFQCADGSLRQGLDSLFVYMEQELQQARLQSSFSEVRKVLSELRQDASRKLTDYQKEAVNAEKEIVLAERKLVKSKDALEKCAEAKLRFFDSESSSRMKEVNESIVKAEKDIREDVASLLRVLRNKDQVLSASRRAHQKLDRECKKSIGFALKKMLVRERESCEARMETLKKLEAAVEEINIDQDTSEFIDRHLSTENCLVLQSQALSILSDLMVTDGDSRGSSTPVGSSSPSGSALSTPRGSFSAPPRSTSASPGPDSWNSSRNVSTDNNTSSAAALLLSKFTNPFPTPPVTGDASEPVLSKRHSLGDHALQHRNSFHNSEQQSTGLTEEVSRHLTRLFYSSVEEWIDRPDSLNMHTGLNVLQLEKDRSRKAPVDENTIKDLAAESIGWLGEIVKTQLGRDAFITVLNQFRSRKVDVGAGFPSLGTVLWTTLDICEQQNDVHSASVIMMLSQTFYRRIERESRENDGLPDRSGNPDEDDVSVGRALGREYLKEMLSAHSLWHNGGFWDKALWHWCIEQLKTIPYDRAWHDMTREERDLAVRRVHNVIFSQVMAIIHSMMELGCTKTQTREFLYRMCTIHQLEESLRQQLLMHLHSSK